MECVAAPICRQVEGETSTSESSTPDNQEMINVNLRLFCKMEGIADAIFLAGSEMPEGEFIVAILIGLPQEYDVVVGLVNNKLQNFKILDEDESDLSVQLQKLSSIRHGMQILEPQIMLQRSWINCTSTRNTKELRN